MTLKETANLKNAVERKKKKAQTKKISYLTNN